MFSIFSRHTWIILLFLLVAISLWYIIPHEKTITTLGQEVTISPDMEALYTASNVFIERSQNDSAIIYLNKLLHSLEEKNIVDSSFGLKVQLAKGKALEQDNQNKEAMVLLNELRDKSKANEQWETYAKTCLELAELHRKIFRKKEAREHLDLAHATIQKYGLNDISPIFILSIAFWHQDFGYPDSVMLYTDQVLNFAGVYAQNSKFQLDISTLSGIRLRRNNYPQAIKHYQDAIKIAKELKDYSNLSYLYNEITDIYTKNDNLAESLKFSDSTIQACYQAIADGHDDIYVLCQAYKLRSKLYSKQGRPDSALNYGAKGYSQELAFFQQQERDRIIEIDERYENDKKAFQISQQEKTIEQERKSRFLSLLFALFTMVFAGVLAYYYSQLRRSNEKIIKQAQLLQKSDEAKSRFFANISHELRTPLTLILGPVRMLLGENTLEERQFSLLHLANENGKQLNYLINQILDLQKMEVDAIELKLESTPLVKFFRKHVSQFQSLAEQKQLNLSFHSTVEAHTFAELDQEKCRQILYNLLSNAFKFTSKGDTVRVSLAIENKRLQLEVADSGRGIAEEDLPFVFDRFFQASSNGVAEGGTGIGLALCKAYVELFGGEINVKSTKGIGTSFKISFPINLQATPSQAKSIQKGFAQVEILASANTSLNIASEKQDAQLLRPKNRPSILVVEDSLHMQAYIRAILEDKYHIITVNNGAEALQLLNISHSREQEPPSKPHPLPELIISDLMMPQVDGYQLLEQLKSHTLTAHIPAIMLTARATQKDRLKALRLGIDDYLTKPFNKDELLSSIHHLLTNARARIKEQDTKAPLIQPPSRISQNDQKWLAKFEVYVKHQHADPLLTIPALAEAFAMSESSLLRHLKRLTGLTPLKYVQEVRLDQARQLLEKQVCDSVAEVAERVGFNDTRVFSRNFKKRFGTSPSDLLKSIYQ